MSNPSLFPATLDLTDNARLAINGLLGSLDPRCDYEPYFLTFFDVHPAYSIHWSSMPSGVLPKYLEALPLMRLMSGSREQLDLEQGMLDVVVRNCAQDGMIYDLALPTRPWNTSIGYGVKGWNEDYANMAGNGRLVSGFTYHYQVTGDDIWRQRAQRCAERMLELAVVKGNYAYYPNVGLGNDFSYPRVSGWVHTDEPGGEFEGSEGSTLFYLWQPLRGFMRWYRLSGDERFLELAKKSVAFGLQSRFWGGLHDIEPLAGTERGHFWGHYHGHTAAFRALLDYAIAADDWHIKLFVRDTYEWARHHGIPRLGIFPGNGGFTEGCTVADMVGLAVALSDAGVGDYWDDVDQYARNGLLMIQATDREELERVSQTGRERPPEACWGGEGDLRFAGFGGVLPGQEDWDRIIERSVGAYGHLVGARFLYPRLMHCCTGNGPQGLYYAWEGITRRDGDTAAVNLWLNRRSPWLDVWSWLPHEGKLLLRNKGLKNIAVRLPGWTSFAQLRCTLDGQDVQPTRLGNRALFSGLRGDEELVLQVPVVTETTVYTLANLNHRTSGVNNERYECTFRGNTALSVVKPGTHPGGQELGWYRLWRRAELCAERAPLREAADYVHPEKVIRW